MEETKPSDQHKALSLKVGRLLRKHRLRLATAESCTGGQIASQITSVAGASHYFESGVIPYSNRAKVQLLSVSKTLIEKKGAVSGEVAKAMAEGIHKNADVDLGLSVTGIAGPDGGSHKKPVGLVFIALSDQKKTELQHFLFSGSRKTIQCHATQAALNMLITYLEKYTTPNNIT